MTRLCPIFSGSKGNSIYLSCGDSNILIDAGKSAKQLEISLRENGIDATKINAILVTHEHVDHVSALRVFASRYGIKVYSSKGTLSALKDMSILNGKFAYDEIPSIGREICGMFATPFYTSHDSTESVGYIIDTQDGKKVAIATDMGFMSDSARESINSCDTIFIESNHDVGMLKNGRYPYYLKRRILSKKGHLSNSDCANELPGFVRSGAKRLILAHLSEENNTPDVAYQTAVCSLNENGMKEGTDFDIYIAPKENNGEQNIVF